MRNIKSILLGVTLIVMTFACTKQASVTQNTDDVRSAKEQAEKEAGENTGEAYDNAKEKELNQKEKEEAQYAETKENTAYHFDLGFKAHNAGEYGKAIDHFNKCIQLKPDYTSAYSARANSKFKSGDTNGACADWKKAESMGDVSAGSMVKSYCF